MTNRGVIEELAVDMHKKKTRMQELHVRSQQGNSGSWTGEDEAFYQIARAEYYRAKNQLEAAVTEYATKGSENADI
jgi:hypothetical protein